MRDEWEHAHTDYTMPVQRRIPASLAETESDWRHYLERSTPNGWLIRNNAMTEALVSGRPMYLLHVTKGIDAIRTSRQLHVSTGCLVGALYCSPLASQHEGLRPHNLGAYLMRTKPSTTPMIFEVTPDAPIRPKGVDYLQLGAIHLRTYLRYQNFLTPAENTQLDGAVLSGLRGAAPFLDVALRNAAGHATAAPAFIDQLSDAVPRVPFLGYLYFEVLSEYLMLHSATPETKTYAQAGELNNWLYKRLAFAAVADMDQRSTWPASTRAITGSSSSSRASSRPLPREPPSTSGDDWPTCSPGLRCTRRRTRHRSPSRAPISARSTEPRPD
ncbi:hypothetical protein AB0C90_34355 [Streptomyces sp. NPDC048550]|uniref:hypothetical protein n=1 Tax=Streptomyces sp. NPDC048550 TaxID=3155739 RepID=UPI0034492AA2